MTGGAATVCVDCVAGASITGRVRIVASLVTTGDLAATGTTGAICSVGSLASSFLEPDITPGRVSSADRFVDGSNRRSEWWPPASDAADNDGTTSYVGLVSGGNGMYCRAGFASSAAAITGNASY
jgi:hypothetical protein